MKFLPLFLIICATTICSAQSDFWQRTAGPQDYQVEILARDSTGGIYVVHSYNASIYHSRDEGRTWKELPSTPQLISSLAIDKAGRLVAGQASGGAGTLQGVVASDDMGATWDTLHSAASAPRSMTLTPDESIFFISGANIFRKVRGQPDWTKLTLLPGSATSPVNRIRGLTLAPNGDLFAATEAGVWRSTSNGTGWSRASTGLADSVIRAVVFAGGDLYATGRDSAIYRSSNSGEIWELVPVAGRLPVVAASAAGEPVVIGTLDGEIFRQQSRGGEWIEGRAPGLYVTALIHVRPGVLVAGGSLYGTFRSSDAGATWVKSNQGINNAPVDAIAVTPDGTIFVGVVGQFGGFIYSTTDNGATWSGGRPEPAPAGIWCLAALPNGTVMAGTEGTGIYRTTDGGRTWTQQNSGLGNLTIRSLAVRPNGVVLAGTEGAGVFQSTNNGTTWTQTTLNRFQYWALAVHPDGTLLAGASNGPIHYSSDGGATWKSVSGFGATTDIQALTVARDGSIYAASFQNGVFRSTDVGRSWKLTTMTDKLLFAAVSTPSGETWIGGRSGARRTLDGITWDTVNSGAGNFWIHALGRDSSGHLLAGAAGSGFYRSLQAIASVATTTISRAAGSITVLPNPISEGSTIRLSLAHGGSVRVRIHDILGATRATLFEGKLGAGEHDMAWIEGLEPGIYYCVIESNGATSSTRVEVR